MDKGIGTRQELKKWPGDGGRAAVGDQVGRPAGPLLRRGRRLRHGGPEIERLVVIPLPSLYPPNRLFGLDFLFDCSMVCPIHELRIWTSEGAGGEPPMPKRRASDAPTDTRIRDLGRARPGRKGGRTVRPESRFGFSRPDWGSLLSDCVCRGCGATGINCHSTRNNSVIWANLQWIYVAISARPVRPSGSSCEGWARVLTWSL